MGGVATIFRVYIKLLYTGETSVCQKRVYLYTCSILKKNNFVNKSRVTVINYSNLNEYGVWARVGVKVILLFGERLAHPRDTSTWHCFEQAENIICCDC